MDGERLWNTIDFTITSITDVLSVVADRNWTFNKDKAQGNWVLAMTMEGDARYEAEGVSCMTKKGDLLFFQQGISRTAHCVSDCPWRFTVIKFQIAALNDYTGGVLYETPWFTSGLRNSLEARFIEADAEWRSMKPGYMLRCKSCIFDIVSVLLRETLKKAGVSGYDAAFDDIAAMIAENNGANYSVDKLAETVNLSPSHFRLLFKRYFGHSVLEYQNHVRMTRARSLLLSGLYRVQEVAAMVGVDDVYYFSRLFKKTMGYSPSKLFNLSSKQ